MSDGAFVGPLCAAWCGAHARAVYGTLFATREHVWMNVAESETSDAVCKLEFYDRADDEEDFASFLAARYQCMSIDSKGGRDQIKAQLKWYHARSFLPVPAQCIEPVRDVRDV